MGFPVVQGHPACRPDGRSRAEVWPFSASDIEEIREPWPLASLADWQRRAADFPGVEITVVAGAPRLSTWGCLSFSSFRPAALAIRVYPNSVPRGPSLLMERKPRCYRYPIVKQISNCRVEAQQCIDGHDTDPPLLITVHSTTVRGSESPGAFAVSKAVPHQSYTHHTRTNSRC